MRSGAYPGTQSVRRAIALLKVFTDARQEWGLTDVARAAGLHKATAYRLLTALEAEGMVERNPETDGWRLGHEAIVLGALAQRSSNLVSAARPEIEALVRETGETATLEVLVGNEVEILDGLEGPSVVAASSEVGTRWPAHATSTGKALLAEMTVLPRGRFRPLTRHTITTSERFRRELERVRERGYAIALEELEEGYVAIGAVVRDARRRAVGAISIGGPAARLTERRISTLGPAVLRSADRVSRRLGAGSATGPDSSRTRTAARARSRSGRSRS